MTFKLEFEMRSLNSKDLGTLETLAQIDPKGIKISTPDGQVEYQSKDQLRGLLSRYGSISISYGK